MPPKTSTARGRSQHARNSSFSSFSSLSSLSSQSANEKEPEEPFHPAADAATFRDLLIFEERLKQNAARLQARKRKYELLLFGFVTFILLLSHFVVSSPRSSAFLQYSLAAVLMICLTTLFLFFASGMHAERIRSANKFVPQANRSLRNFNMYLNTKTTADSRWWSITRLLRSTEPVRRHASSTTDLTENSRAGCNTGTSTPRRALSSIPPSQNSRGELIFSNKVSPEFREGYERYRAAFERRRAERMAAKRAQSWKRWFDWVLGRPSLPPPGKSGSTTASPHLAQASIRPSARNGKFRSARTTRASASASQAGSGSEAANPARSTPQLDDLSEGGLSEGGLSEGGLSDDGYPPSIGGSSMSGH